MTGSTFGTLFRVSTFGESHGAALGVIIDGCPAGFVLDLAQIECELARRRPGQSLLVSQRKEQDEFEVLSGLFDGKTTGAPIAMLVRNEDVRSQDYEAVRNLFRPGHADFTYFAKYGHRDYRGGGRSSGRETVARVMAGALAKQLLACVGISFCGGVVQIGEVKARNYVWDQVEQNEVRCVDPDLAGAMRDEVTNARKSHDSIGGVVEVQALGVPPGLGQPVFGKLDAAIAGAMMSIPAVKGVEIGAGFAGAALRGSQMHDEMFVDGFHSNNHGGILGGISSGAPIVVRIAVKPTASIPQLRQTVNTSFEATTVETKGRHDPCVAIRAVPVCEAMFALVLIDYFLQEASAMQMRGYFSPLKPVDYGLATDKK
jgi:chorismate synthase